MNKMMERINKKKRDSAAKQQAENERQCQSILLHAEQLAEELNLRLLLESELTASLIYVDSVTVTKIHFPDEDGNPWDIIQHILKTIGKYIRSFLKRIFCKETGSKHKSR